MDQFTGAQALFAPDGHYLNTATMGLPPRTTLDTLAAALDAWGRGPEGFLEWDEATHRARDTYARLVGVPVDWVAVGSQVSVFAGLVAASLPTGARVVCAEGDFTSLLFPLLVQEDRGVTVDAVPLERVADAVDARTDLVAVSAVQSSDGRVADLGAIRSAAAAHGARTLIDTTQATGWLPIDVSRFDVTVGGGYKWLLTPRGVAFCTVRPEALADIRPHTAGWYAGASVHDSYYGTPLRLAASARRLDVSPAWHSWIGAVPSLDLLDRVGIEAIHAHNLALANRFRAGLGLPPGDSAIVSLTTGDGVAARLRRANVRFAGRAGRLRFAFHLYNTGEDVDRALEAMAGWQPIGS